MSIVADPAIDLEHPSPEPKPLARVYGEAYNELPHDLYIPPEALEVFLESFEGPLDLLLYLIRKQNINVLDIPMADLTRQYLGYVEMMRRTQLEHRLAVDLGDRRPTLRRELEGAHQL